MESALNINRQASASQRNTSAAPSPGAQRVGGIDGQEPETDEPFVYDSVLARVDGNLPLLHELIAMFREDCPKWLMEMRESAQQGNARRLQLAAHTLRGVVANFGASTSEKKARVLEMMGRSGNLTGAAAAILDLEAAIERLHLALDAFPEPSPL